MKIATAFLLLLGITVGSAGSIGFAAQGPTAERQQFIRVEAPVVVLTHVRVIDGTGAAARDDQTIVIADGKIQSIGPSAPANLPANAQTIDLRGLHRIARPCGDAQPHVFPHGRISADVFQHGDKLPASLSGAGRHNDSHYRQRCALHRS